MLSYANQLLSAVVWTASPNSQHGANKCQSSCLTAWFKAPSANQQVALRYWPGAKNKNGDLKDEIMFCCLRKETKGLKDQAGNHKRNPPFLSKGVHITHWEGKSFVPSRTPQLTASLLRMKRWRGGWFSLEAGTCRIILAWSITLLNANAFSGGRLNLIVKLLNMAGSSSSRITSKGGFVRRGPD